MTTFNPFFSIITPFYNAEKYVLPYIKKLKLQTFTNWECILIDDYSKDNGYKLIQEFIKNDKRIKIYKNNLPKEIKGPYQARNFGLNLAIGNYICFLDIDDSWKENMLEIKYRILKKTHKIDIIFTNIAKCNNGIQKGIIAPIKYIPIKSQIRIHNPIWLSTSTVKRDLILKHRFECINHEDFVFWAKLIRDKPHINLKHLNKVLGEYNISKNSISSDKLLSLKWHYNCYLKLGYGKFYSILCFFPLILLKLIVLMKQNLKYIRIII